MHLRLFLDGHTEWLRPVPLSHQLPREGELTCEGLGGLSSNKRACLVHPAEVLPLALAQPARAPQTSPALPTHGDGTRIKPGDKLGTSGFGVPPDHILPYGMVETVEDP